LPRPMHRLDRSLYLITLVIFDLYGRIAGLG
jgi:hypothetical protein